MKTLDTDLLAPKQFSKMTEGNRMILLVLVFASNFVFIGSSLLLAFGLALVLELVLASLVKIRLKPTYAKAVSC